jgi:hypothetical protein
VGDLKFSVVVLGVGISGSTGSGVRMAVYPDMKNCLGSSRGIRSIGRRRGKRYVVAFVLLDNR